MKVLDLIDSLQDLIESSSAVPFSSKVVVDPDEVLDIVDEIREAMPEDLKVAIRVSEQEKMIVENAKDEAARIMEQAESKVKELIDTDSITKNAYNKAQNMIKRANTEALNMKIGSVEYSTKILKELQDQLRNMVDTIEQNKMELKEYRKSAVNSKPIADRDNTPSE